MDKKLLKSVKAIIKIALEEDIGKGDITTNSTIKKTAKAKALIRIKEQGVLCGIEVAEQVFKEHDKKIKFTKTKNDGDILEKGDIVAKVEGNARSILSCERIALNFLQRLSGVATTTKQYTEILKQYKTKLLDTRKTIPCYRLLEKYAVKTGGGVNHRIGLYDMYLIKDNHIKSCGSIGKAITKAIKDKKIKKTKIEVETKNIDEVKEALMHDIDVIMLDNMSFDEIEIAVSLIKKANNKIKTEASGGININNIEEFAKIGVNFVSIGTALTLSSKAIDFSLDFSEE